MEQNFGLTCQVNFCWILRNGYNIGKLVTLDYNQKKKDGYLVASPCQEYTIKGETYTAIGTLYDHSKLDSMLSVKSYNGNAYLFMLDNDGKYYLYKIRKKINFSGTISC